MPNELTAIDKKNREYFAAQDSSDCVSLLAERIDEYYGEMKRSGRINLYRNSYFKRFQGFILKGAIYHSGSLGELTNTYVNHYANLSKHAVNMVCQQKLAYDVQLTVDDAQAQDQVKMAKGLLYLYANRSDADVDGKLRLATEMQDTFGESYVSVLWNKDLGRMVAGEFDKVRGVVQELKEGDNEYEVWTPFDVIIDTTLPSNSLKKWLILRKWENKFDVAARFPKWADEITALTAGSNIGDTQLTYSLSDVSDLIPVYYFFHSKTAAVPRGRTIIFVDTNIIMADGKLDYREIPVYRMATGDLWGSPHGYSPAFDTLPLQESVDRLCSAILTNQLTSAVQNFLIAKGSNIEYEELYGGLNVIEWDASLGEAGKPTTLQMTNSPKEVFDFIKMNIEWMGTLRGINDAIRGNADLILKGQASGAALAMLSSNSIQFNSDLQKAYVRLAEQVGTATIHNIQDFGFPDGLKSEREGMSLSATQKYYRRKFSKENVDKIDKIIVRYGNPLAQTTSGRLQQAETLLQSGKITPDQYFEVMETGDLESQLSSEQSQLHLIKEENEAMLRGEVPPVMFSDNHALHIPEHLAEIANLDARKSPEVLKAFQEHVQGKPAVGPDGKPVIGPDGRPVMEGGHIPALKSLDPILAALLKQPVLAAPPAQPLPGGAPPPAGSTPAGPSHQIPPPPAPGAPA